MSATATPRLTDGGRAPATDSTIAIVAPGSKPRRPGGAGRRRAGAVVLHVLLILAGISMVFPFIWMLLTSLKTLPQLLQNPLEFLPNPWTVKNYTDAWEAVPFGQAYLNSAYITLLVVVGTLITASMAGYAFARIKFRGSRVLFIVFLATQMIPAQVTLIPFYLLMSNLGWVDSHLALIVPGMIANPFAVFLMRQFVLSLPKELEEAALVDGAGRLRIFFSVVLPNLRPGLAALAIITSLGVWNAFLFPLVLLNSPDLFTVPLLLTSFESQHGSINYGMVMAASAIATVPMLIVFVIGQRKILNSMAASGLGGR
ncbi:carbohydrate ABC transporter permease [Microbacterium arabinogalactanolyticum]|uniref:Sn-glycerol-3-phosphate transport system permease protein UgpE n=1 Tax=Microbacterium arabinogalactanolyticum TaxID=69365 RepID=A0ABQ5NDD4_9MICO|nr:carbohydrate ABC transporter permease [Microbacterium arabinogalactanolyticum]GLC83416.1 sn-glycerol-3-phosphate transport system permease protein UgpE [Microbacterium arabinogalactanolyticum]